MFRFLMGVALGALGAYYMQQRPQRDQLEMRMREFQDRTNKVLDESRRILDESRGELSAAFEAGRESMQQKAERLRHAAMAAGKEGTSTGS